MARPLQLVSCDAGGTLSVGAEATQVLRGVKGPVAVVAVCGRARQGKSFILNQIAASCEKSGDDRSKAKPGGGGFEVAPTHKPCTKGIWLWSKPIPRKSPDGGDYHIILLDTEGIDAYDQTGQYSTQIFSLAVLLSSLFVYNQMGGIDEAALDRLSLVTEMTKHIRVRSEGKEGEASAGELGACSPYFMWLLRDFFLCLREDTGEEITARDYLETALKNVPGGSSAAAAKNQIRDSIRELFPDRDCHTLVRPMNDERKLQELGKVPHGELRPEFREGLLNLLERVFQRATPKRLGATMLTGPMLAGLADMYVTAINKGAVPVIATAWQGVAEAECRKAVEEGEAAYDAALDRTTSAEEEALAAAHAAALTKALAAYQLTAVGDPQTKQAFERMLTKSVTDRFDQHRQQAVSAAALQCLERLHAHEAALRAAANAPDATVASLVQRLSAELTAYGAAAHGPSKWLKALEFVAGPACEVLVACASRREVAAAAAGAEARTARDKAEAEVATLRAERATLQETAGQHRVALARAEEQARASKQDAERCRQELAQSASTASNAQSQASKAQAEAAELRGEASRLRAELATASGEGATRSAEAAELRRELEAARLAAARHEADLAAARQDTARAEAAAAALRSEAQVAAAGLEAARRIETELRSGLGRVEGDSRAYRQETDKLKATLEATREVGRQSDIKHKAALIEKDQLVADLNDLKSRHKATAESEARLLARKQELEVEVQNLMRQLKSAGEQLKSMVGATETHQANLQSRLQAVTEAAAPLAPAGLVAEEDQFHDADDGVPGPAAPSAGGQTPGKRARDKENDGNAEATQPKAARRTVVSSKGKKAMPPPAAPGSAAASMTVSQLKQALTDEGHAAEVWPLRTKTQLVELYNRVMPA